MKPSGSSIPVARIQPLVEIGLAVGPPLADARGPGDADRLADGLAADGALVVGLAATGLLAGVAVGVVLPQAASRTATASSAPIRAVFERRPDGDIAGLGT
jgi:hypothetical protein